MDHRVDGANHADDSVELSSLDLTSLRRISETECADYTSPEGEEVFEDDEALLLVSTNASVERSDPEAAGSASIANVSFNMTNNILGAGLIGLPFALSEAGPLPGILLLCVLAWMTDYSIRLLIISGIRSASAKTYEQLCEDALGGFGFYAVTVMTACMTFGNVSAYLMVIGDTVPVVAAHWSGLTAVDLTLENVKTDPLALLTNRTVVISSIAIFAVLPLALIRDISKLSFSSFVSLSAVSVITFIVLSHSLYIAFVAAEPLGHHPLHPHNGTAIVDHILHSGLAVPEPSLLDRLRGFVLGDSGTVFGPALFPAAGIISQAYIVQHNCFRYYDSLKGSSPLSNGRFNTVVHISVAASWVCCAAIAIAGFWTWRDDVKGNVLRNFAMDNPAASVGRLCLAVNMLATYPLECFACRASVLAVIKRLRPSATSDWHVMLTLAIWSCSLAVSLSFTNVGAMFELTGSVAASSLGFILPATSTLVLKARRDAAPWPDAPSTVLSISVAIFGVCAMVTGTGQVVMNMLSGSQRGG